MHQLAVAAADSGEYHIWDMRSGLKVNTVKGINIIHSSIMLVCVILVCHVIQHVYMRMKMSVYTCVCRTSDGY